MIKIQVKKNLAVPIEASRLEGAISSVLEAHNRSEQTGLTLVLSDDHQLQQLNRDFMGIDAATDVLSFPSDLIDPDDQETYLGDIVISVPRAVLQAEENNKSAESELILLAVHGTLHLLGYDHATAEDKDRMWEIQSDLVEKLV